jgi:hypothetical protein
MRAKHGRASRLPARRHGARNVRSRKRSSGRAHGPPSADPSGSPDPVARPGVAA